jgi:HEAT repeat protein
MEITAKKEDEGKLIATLTDAEAPEFDKDVACRQLAVVGTKACVPALAALLANDHLHGVARHAMTQIPDPAADEALRTALKAVEGMQLVAVVNTIGNRGDREAVGDLVKLLGHADAAVAAETARSLAKIGGRQAGKALQEALGDSRTGVRAAVGDACLTLADNLAQRGMRDVAVGVYQRTAKADVPKAVRDAATLGTERAG